MNDVPSAGERDLGGPDWEKALVRRIRERNLAWTSEKTYRAWCRRFIAASGEKPINSLDHGDVRKWLSDLAVKERVSVSTQSQALNAVVFFFREVLTRDPGDFSDFTRARRGRKVPSVLTQAECKRLFEAMQGTGRLMAELMYAAGLRLSELLRLRVKDVDLERLQLAVQFGKGGKSRLTMIPPKLEPALRAHRERLRGLHAKDRETGLPGVELPEALELKWPKAGEKFIWFWFWPSRNLMRDHRRGIIRRHHVLDVTFQKMIREAVEKAGFDKRVSPHTLRHSFATHLLASGVGIRDVQDLLAMPTSPPPRSTCTRPSILASACEARLRRCKQPGLHLLSKKKNRTAEDRRRGRHPYRTRKGIGMAVGHEEPGVDLAAIEHVWRAHT